MAYLFLPLLSPLVLILAAREVGERGMHVGRRVHDVGADHEVVRAGIEALLGR